MPLRTLCSLALAFLVVAAAAAQPIISTDGEQMRLNLAFSSVLSDGGGGWSVTLWMEDDNENPALGSSFRRWWHCRIGNLNPTTGESLNIAVLNAGYSDTILPVWSLSTDGGATYGAYERVPPNALFSNLNFMIQTPRSVTDIRLAKYFPYTTVDKEAFLATIAGDEHVTITVLGQSVLGRDIERVDITDASVSPVGKRRVWIHSGIHPAETTSYFAVEGLIDFLLSGEPEAVSLLRGCLFNIVPMANPDGVFLGNYRTNADSVNVESDWRVPYDSTNAEVAVLRTAIEQLMGTSASPGSNPIEVVLNLHSSHNLAVPFHFQHRANFDIDGTGVIPAVNALEGEWIAAFRARSPFVDLGSTALSSLSGRPFVESMMHDRWSIDPLWTGPPNNLPLVMAITYEGTYGAGPDAFSWNTPDDYRLNGREMAEALFDYFGLELPAVRPAGLLLR